MKRKIWISILILFFTTSCTNELKTYSTQETIYVGSQPIQLISSSGQSVYEGTSALPTNLVIENQSDQPVYLPWGNDPGYNLIIVGIDSTYRTIFGKIPPTPEATGTDYLSIQPGDKVTTNFTLPTMPEPGRYNVCAEIVIIGTADDNQIHDVGLSSLKTAICIEILYK